MELLPIGSVVMLEGGDKRLMIYGILQTNGENNTNYDYLGCLYPEGYIDIEHIFMFNHKDIIRIDHTGLADGEHQEFRTKLNEMLEEINFTQEQEDGQESEPEINDYN